MSNHFTYEIDERNLRMQLGDHVVPYKEEAWYKFESFSDSQIQSRRDNRMKGISITLNRNVVLPVVFGVIVILFSFLLVNFISIKNPKSNSDQKAEASLIPAQKELAKPEIKASVKSQSPVVEQKQTTPAVVPPAIEPGQKTASSAQIPAPAQHVTSAVVQSAPDSGTAANEEVKTEPVVKKKRRRPASEVVESEVLPEIRPTLVTEERDLEIRPD